MKCKRCNRTLKAKSSLDRGYGPTCFKIVQKAKQTPVINNELLYTIYSQILTKSKNYRAVTILDDILSTLQHSAFNTNYDLLVTQTYELSACNQSDFSKELLSKVVLPILRIAQPSSNPNLVKISL